MFSCVSGVGVIVEVVLNGGALSAGDALNVVINAAMRAAISCSLRFNMLIAASYHRIPLLLSPGAVGVLVGFIGGVSPGNPNVGFTKFGRLVCVCTLVVEEFRV